MDDITAKLAEALRWIADYPHTHDSHLIAMRNGAREALRLYDAAKARPVQDERAAFEAWTRRFSTLSLELDAHGHYACMEQEILWLGFQAGRAAKAKAPEGASGGDLDANARLGLAGAKSTCAHEFALDHASSIPLCVKCGIGEVAANKQARAAMAATPAPAEDDALHAFKNFHRNLCNRFGYFHDDENWQRDLCSLEEHIAGYLKLALTAAPAPAKPVAWTLRETLDKRETTCNAHLWFTNPVNSAWAPLYAAPLAATPAPAPQWVPVSERLPDANRKVLATYTNELGNRRTIVARWTPAKTVEADADDDEGVAEYDEATDTYYLCEGWWEVINNWGDYSRVFVNEGKVDHWMPLPAAPDGQGKEASNG